jgi:hypothetical protein
LKGIAGSTLFGFYSRRKEFLEKEITYKDMLDHHTILGKKTLYEDLSEERSSFTNLHEDSIKKMKTQYENKWHKFYSHQQVMRFEVMGHEDRYCGSMINVH